MDGFLVETTGQCKQGMDIAYDGPGVITRGVDLANTGRSFERSQTVPGNRPSQEGAADRFDRALKVCFRGGFQRDLAARDSKFAQTEHLDRWDDDPRVRLSSAYEACANLKGLAEDLPARAWKPLRRPAAMR